MSSGILAVALAALIFGTAGLFVKTLAIPATAIAGFRLLVPALVVLGFRGELRSRVLTNPNKILLIASSMTALRILFWVRGFLAAPMSKAVVVLYTWPLFLTLFGVVFLKERVTVRTTILLITAFAGILVFGSDIQLNSPEHVVGMAYMLGVAILNAGVIAVFKKQLEQHSPEEILFYDNCVGSIIFLPFVVWYASDFTLAQVSYATFYGLVIGCAGYYLLYFGLSRVKASVVSVLSYLEVLSATVLGVLCFGELVSWRMIIGGAMILVPAVLVRNK